MKSFLDIVAEATPGPWCVADECVVWTQINDPIETTYDIGYPIAEARRQKSFWNGTRWPEGQPEANARLIALAPSLAARVIEQDARIARLTEALIRISIEAKGTGTPNESLRVVRTVAMAALEDGQ